jgi:prepilin-type N-terminal cleavage/methylation domain-containing protein
MHKLISRQQGFTIIELLIVIVVIGILATISIVAYNGFQQKAKLSVAQQELSTIGKQASLYAVVQGSQPTTNAAWAQIIAKSGLSGKLGINKDFIICANNQSFAVVAHNPVGYKEQTGSTMHLVSPSGVGTATWDSSVATGIYTSTKTCSHPGVITPTYTYSIWASQLGV